VRRPVGAANILRRHCLQHAGAGMLDRADRMVRFFPVRSYSQPCISTTRAVSTADENTPWQKVLRSWCNLHQAMQQSP
jgi:hypothetical protein